LNYTARFIELASEVNSQMPDYVVGKVTAALNDDLKSIKGSSILIMGAAYKPNVGDVRESPALDVIHLLLEKGAILSYHDPYVATLAHEGVDLQSVELTKEILSRADCVVVITHHESFDWDFVTEWANLIVDTRHVIDEASPARVVFL
jgi:UDP-N-acetyl-D-glucosamine dehydrogenase